MKLARAVRNRTTGVLYVLDEPSICLHALDVQVLLRVFQALIDNGATVVVIEHDLDVIRNADYIGPAAGTRTARSPPAARRRTSAQIPAASPDDIFKRREKRTMELPACPVETTLMLIGDKWKVLILRELMGGTKRFGALKKSIGTVSQKVLTAQLRDMEDKGLLTRKVYAEVPPRVEYTLTDTGYSLKPILDAMVAWGTDYQEKNR